VVPKPEYQYTIENVDRDYNIRLNNEPLPGMILPAFRVTSDDGYTVTFTDASWGDSNSSVWNFGDGTKEGVGKTVVHTYRPGRYHVSLWARNNETQAQVFGDIEIPLNDGKVSSLFFTS
jgi:PKD repeat protein